MPFCDYVNIWVIDVFMPEAMTLGVRNTRVSDHKDK